MGNLDLSYNNDWWRHFMVKARIYTVSLLDFVNSISQLIMFGIERPYSILNWYFKKVFKLAVQSLVAHFSRAVQYKTA